MAKGKKYRDAARRYDREMFHGPREALELVKSLATKNFDESIDLVVRLGVCLLYTSEAADDLRC